MKLSYDPRYNIAYLRLREPGEEVETLCLSDELNVDIAADGTVYGIEFLNASEQLGSTDVGRLVVLNEASQKASEIALELSSAG